MGADLAISFFGAGWSETGCTFYMDDKLFQKETYHDCKANTNIDDSFFNPKNFEKARR